MLRESLGEHTRIRAHLEPLTEREREVLDLMILDKQNKFIAQDLGVSPRTIEIRRARDGEDERAVRSRAGAHDDGHQARGGKQITSGSGATPGRSAES